MGALQARVESLGTEAAKPLALIYVAKVGLAHGKPLMGSEDGKGAYSSTKTALRSPTMASGSLTSSRATPDLPTNHSHSGPGDPSKDGNGTLVHAGRQGRKGNRHHSSLTRAALNTCQRQKSNFLSVSVKPLGAVSGALLIQGLEPSFRSRSRSSSDNLTSEGETSETVTFIDSIVHTAESRLALREPMWMLPCMTQGIHIPLF